MRQKILFLVLLFTIIVPVKVDAILVCDPDNPAIQSNYFINLNIRKIDIDDRTELNGAYFNVSTINNDFVFETEQSKRVYTVHTGSNVSREERYILSGDKIVPTEILYNILPSNIQSIYDSINTIEDFQNFVGEGNYYSNNTYCVEWKDENGVMRDTILSLHVNYPVKIVETKSPIGYQKKDVIAIATVYFYFDYVDGENDIKDKQIIFTLDQPVYYRYDRDVNYFDYVNGSDTINAYLDYYANHIDNYSHNIPNEKGTVELGIDNTIDDKYVYTTSSDTKVRYKITVSNSGNASSGGNMVLILLPNDLKVDKNSISNNGTYNEEENKVLWDIDYIDPTSNIDLYFDIIVSSKSKSEYRLISSISNAESSITSPQVTLKVNASDKFKNPDTGDLILITITIMIGCLVLGTCLYRRKYNNKKI